jgi:hypothetical protein
MLCGYHRVAASSQYHGSIPLYCTSKITFEPRKQMAMKETEKTPIKKVKLKVSEITKNDMCRI